MQIAPPLRAAVIWRAVAWQVFKVPFRLMSMCRGQSVGTMSSTFAIRAKPALATRMVGFLGQ